MSETKTVLHALKGAERVAPITLAADRAARHRSAGGQRRPEEHRDRARSPTTAARPSTSTKPWSAGRPIRRFPGARPSRAAATFGRPAPGRRGAGRDAAGALPQERGLCRVQGVGQRRRLWLPVGQVKAGIRSPRRGDMAIFDWDDHPGKDHCGIVLGFNPANMIVETVEGSTRPGNGVSRESNSGDGVFEKDRGLGAFGIGGGFVLIDF